VKLQAFRSEQVFEFLAAEWNVLLKRNITDTPFSSFEWHLNWWNAYHPGDIWTLTARDDADRLVGIASFFIANEDGVRRVHFVGCEDVTDYLDLLVDRDHTAEVYDLFARALLENRSEFDEIDLCNIPLDSPTRTQFAAALEQYGFQVTLKQQEVCPIIHLPDNFDAYLDGLDKKQAKEIRRKLRIVEAQGDEISWYIVNSNHDLDAEIDTFLRLMTASHPEKAQFLTDEQHVRFFKSIVPAAANAGWLQLVFLQIAGERVAAYLNFDYNQRVWVYNSGLDPNKAAALSPGIVLLAYNIEHAIQNGYVEFDFLRGDEPYKYRMGAVDTQVFNLRAHYSG